MSQQNSPRVAMLGSYVPRRCGIATFTNALGTAISTHVSGMPLRREGDVQIVAVNDRNAEYTYGPEVCLEIDQHRREDYRYAADVLNNARVDVLSLQHEYGLYGGEWGDYVLDLLDRFDGPIIPTLHTILTEPTPKPRDVLKQIADRSYKVVVMADRAKRILREVYDVPERKIRMIHHGVPDVPFSDTEPFKARFKLVGRPVILTFGLLGPSKNIEVMLEALARVVPDHPDVTYIVLGVTHPGVRRDSGELYRFGLERRAVELGIERNVQFHKRFVSDSDLIEYLQAADVYVTPYQNKEQITSGTLAFALASGRAIISTPYWHAQELLASGRGELVQFGDVDQLAAALNRMLSDHAHRQRIRETAHAFGRNMVWSQVARQYGEVFAESRDSVVVAERATGRGVLLRLSLPEVRLDHLFRMTDDTGMLQHAVYATPDRRHGYCTDDNARALIVAAMIWSLYQDDRSLPYLHIYLSFLHHAQIELTGRFHNLMSFDRAWMDEDGGDDCQGRVLWALGYLASHAPDESTASLAVQMFRAGACMARELDHARAWSFAMLGLHYYLRECPDDVEARGHLTHLADKLSACFVAGATDGWPWYESAVTYDNGRLPQALLIAGHTLGRDDLTNQGIRILRWLMKVQTAEAGHLSVIGNAGWYARGAKRARFDQQPLEAAAMIGACKAAYQASDDDTWLAEMRRCFEWYVGRNDVGLSLVDFKTRGCFDGLHENAVNRNQGAESLLAWLSSLLTMHEMQTGDIIEVG